MGEGTPGRRASAISCGLHRLAEALGDRAHDRVDYAQPEDEPGLRVLVRDDGGSDLLGDDPTDAQKARQCRLMRASQTPSNTSIHPSDPCPLPGHPEAMKMSCRQGHFHARVLRSPDFANCIDEASGLKTLDFVALVP